MAKDDVAKASKNLEQAQNELKDVRNDFGKTKAALESAFDAIDLQIAQILLKIERLEPPPAEPGKPEPKLDRQTESALRALKLELRQLYRQYRNIVTVGNLYVQVDNANKKLEAEAEQLKAYKDLIAFEGNNAVFQFVFTITENNNASSEGTITWPITLGSITLGYDIGDTRQRKSDRQVRVVSSFQDLMSIDCRGMEVAEERRIPRMYPITGEIGLAEVIQDYMRVTEIKGQKFQLGGNNDSYRDKIIFTTTVNGSINPGIELTKRMGQLIEASADIGADRTDAHEVTILLTPFGKTPGGSAPGIIIEEMPTVRVRGRLVEQTPG